MGSNFDRLRGDHESHHLAVDSVAYALIKRIAQGHEFTEADRRLAREVADEHYAHGDDWWYA